MKHTRIRINLIEAMLWVIFAIVIVFIIAFRFVPNRSDITQSMVYNVESLSTEPSLIYEHEIQCPVPFPTSSEYTSKIMSLDYDASDAYLLAKIGYAEAKNEDIECQALIILTVLNRVWSDQFPNTISDVIFQQGQFNSVYSESWDTIDIPDTAWEALKLVESGWDESLGATYFCANGKSEWHKNNLTELFSYGNLTFFIYNEEDIESST